MEQASQKVEQYFTDIDTHVQKCYAHATAARKKGFDPEERVDIPLAKNMAERVEGLMSIVAPNLVGKGVPQRIQELEEKYGLLAWEVALLIAAEVAQEKFCKFKDKKEAMEIGIRTGFAYNTLGIVAAPLEGFIELKIKQRADGEEYVAASYAGPIRGAGGTAASFSVIIVDYVRTVMGYKRYDPTEKEIKRYQTEIRDYHERVTNLQYFPSEDEIAYMIKHLPIEVDGDPTEKIEVSNYKDLPRVETNRVRGGVCLVVGEGLTQKSPKLWKRLSKFGKEFGIDWEFLEGFLELQKKIKAKSKKSETSKEKVTANYTFIKDLVAGRPILTYPMATGGFRLRYGRSQMSGFSTDGLHPATMAMLDGYIATGTQLKLERPGKACSVTPNDSIEGPIVLLEDGTVTRVHTEEEAKQCRRKLKKILFLGDICISYGDFSENGHILVPAGYCAEWWALELQKVLTEKYGSVDLNAAASALACDVPALEKIFADMPRAKVSFNDALACVRQFGVPLHPEYLFFWKLMTKDDLRILVANLKNAEIITEADVPQKIVLKMNEQCKAILENIGLPHTVTGNEFIVIEKDMARALHTTLGIGTLRYDELVQKIDAHASDDVCVILTDISGMTIRDLAGTFVGARMGRPEKAKIRKLKGDPHVLFPVGEEGGRMRSIIAALDVGKITADFTNYLCEACNTETVYGKCERCGGKTIKRYWDSMQQKFVPKPKEPGFERSHRTRPIDIKHYFKNALAITGSKVHPDLIKGVRGTSNEDHIPEQLVKGILRAQHKIYVNKDGTTRYDMSELPITNFRPSDIGTPVEKLHELGYTHDMHGAPLTSDDQICEIFPQDVVLPDFQNFAEEPCSTILLRVARFVDDLLEKLYDEPRFYNVKTKQDLVGHMIIGLAPHISAGLVGRIIGFSATQGFLTHPYYHAGMRRDCDGDEACAILLMDALLNFSRQFLPNRRGAKTMDSPLVLTSRLNPAEVDDQVHGLDIVGSYPLELYEAALEYKNPWDVKVEQIKHRLNTPGQYERYGFTHTISSINQGIHCSAYKTLPSMKEKLAGQMKLATVIRAVPEGKVAASVIEKHFLKDIKGNLRKFSLQEFRCVTCNTKYRRPPLIGKCTTCGGKIVFTISEGSIVKYLGPSIELVEKYPVPEYLKQTIELVRRHCEDNFGKEKEKQIGLAAFGI